MTRRRIKVVAVGNGAALEAHLLGYRRCRFVKLHGIASRQEHQPHHHCGVKHYPSFEAALYDPAVEALDLVVPTYLHADMALEAIARGKHVLIEKPIDVDLEKARKLVDWSIQSGLVVSCVSQFRFSPGIDELARVVERGALGKLLLCDVNLCIHREQDYYDSAVWRNDPRLAGGGVLMMNGIHLIDVLCSLLGTPQVSAARIATTRHYLHVEDVASISLVFRTGLLATLNITSHASRNYPTTIRLTGSRGQAVLLEYCLVQLEIDGEKQRCAGRGCSTEQFFRAQLEDFGAAITRGEPLRTPVEAGLSAFVRVPPA